MAGRYANWMHKKSAGQTSPEDLAGARKVLGDLENQLRLGGITSGSMRRTLRNGTVVVATLANGMPTVNMIPVGGGQRILPARELGEIITTPRSAAAPDGVDADHPEVMLRFGEDFRKSYFYGDAPAGVAGNTGVYVDMFPKGLGQGGNADWVGPDGERLSWYGPSSRAFADAYVHGPVQHGKKVFYLGDVLLDTDKYLERSDTDSGFPDRHIAAAALRDIDGTWWLYTIQYVSANGQTPPLEGGTSLSGLFSYPLAETVSMVGGCHRYRLYVRTDEQGIVRFSVARNSREKLRNTVTGSPDPWFFNRECTEAICHLALSDTNTPGKPWWAARLPRRDNPPDPDYAPPAGTYHGPATSGLRFRLGFDAAGLVDTAEVTDVSIQSGGAAAAVTADYDAETGALNNYTFRFGADLVPHFGFDGVEVLTYQSSRAVGAGTGGDDIVTGVSRYILYANPRDHVVALLRRNVQFDTGLTPPLVSHVLTIELYVDGLLVKEEVVATGTPVAGVVQRWSDSTNFLDGLEGLSITPQYFVYGLLIMYADVFGDPPTGEQGWVETATYLGANAMFAQFPYPAECWFGVASESLPRLPISAFVNAGFNGSIADDNGFFSVTGGAREADTVAFSCWTPNTGMDDSFTFVSVETFENMTGAGGAQARYHPIRVLGKMPVEDRVEDIEK